MGAASLAAQMIKMQNNISSVFKNEKQHELFMALMSTLVTDASLLIQVFGYLLFAIALHVGIPVAALWTFRTATKNLNWKKLHRAGLPAAAATLVLVAMWNRRLNPTSIAFEDVELLMVQPISPVLFWGGTVLAIFCISAAILPQLVKRPRLTGAIFAPALLAFIISQAPNENYNGNNPNVIILGIDSLRPDFLKAYGFPSASLTPNINSALEEMVVIQGATTPTARTFVSYMSLLTGKNPINHGARFNLFPWSQIEHQPSISRNLGEIGYYRLMAMDESRFANFPHFLDFDKVVTPKVGALDFVIGTSYDFMATNLALELPYLGPMLGYVFGNRAAYRTYDPMHHSIKIENSIKDAPAGSPLFLVSHLCLPHWPYLAGSIWAPDDFEQFRRIPGYEDIPTSYFRAISASDKQLSQTLDILRSTGRLDNAIVYIISDHGESFSAQRDSLTNSANGQTIGSFGHGGFILSSEQNSIVFAAQRYRDGRATWRPRTVKADASIIDIAPSIAELVGLEIGNHEGISLIPTLASAEPIGRRPIFLESGIRSINAERSSIDYKAVANEMSNLYGITGDLRFELLPEQAELQLRFKQRGVILGDKIVASIPRAFSEDFGDCWAVSSISERTVRCDRFPSLEPSTYRLQRMVCDYFSADGDYIERWCHSGAPSLH